MKILLVHVDYASGVGDWYREIAAAAPHGLEIETFCVTLDPPGPRLSWREMDGRWLRRETKLMEMYRRLQAAASNCSVLINYNGANLHPEFLDYLPTFNVFCCFDDPESSQTLSEPVASSYDAAFYGNIAARFQYEHWGCKQIAHLPVFTAPSDVPPENEGAELLSARRDVDIVFCGEKNGWRKKRLDALGKAFPGAMCVGKGWEAGRIKAQAMRDLYRRSSIGWNIHNSTGPINRRLFTLAGFGVLPLCDNKTGLGQLFELGREAVGFDTIPEAIDLTRYYLEHEDEREEIARGAYARFWKDYHAAALWGRIHGQLLRWTSERPASHRQARSLPGKTLRSLVRLVRRDAAVGLRAGIHAARAARETFRKELRPLRPTIDESFYLGLESVPYRENRELGHVNKASERLRNGAPLDWPNMLALNWAITALIGQAERIIEIGSGTGPFAEFASVDRRRTIDCFERDDFARQRALEFRSRPNVRYLQNFGEGIDAPYDLLVSVDVVEHVADAPGFLRLCSGLAPRAIFTTPNRVAVRGPYDAGPPVYDAHVREYTSGELYWVLRQYYRTVRLYHMPDYYVPWLEPMDVSGPGHPIVADCREPLGNRRPLSPPAPAQGRED